MVVPKIIFKYSIPCDQLFREMYTKEMEKTSGKYPDIKQILKEIKSIEKLWKKEGSKILLAISKYSGLKWKRKKIICYVVGRGKVSISSPLIVRLRSSDKNYSNFIDGLTHELIHIIQGEEREKWAKAYKNYICKIYKKEVNSVRNHIFLYAVHKAIYLNLFGEKRFKEELKRMQKFPTYKRALEIVERDGYEKIIKEFKIYMNK